MNNNLLRKKTYSCWSGMKQRCTNKNSQSYKDYGGRGITVYERWINSFENFLNDMGEKPEGLSIDSELTIKAIVNKKCGV